MLTTEYAEYYGISPQGDNESDRDFQYRVAENLRNQNLIIEAHEAINDERYEESDNVMTGVLGAIAQALQGTNYGGRQVDNDFVSGKLAEHQMSPEGQKEKEANEMLVNMLLLGLSPDDINKLTGE